MQRTELFPVGQHFISKMAFCVADARSQNSRFCSCSFHVCLDMQMLDGALLLLRVVNGTSSDAQDSRAEGRGKCRGEACTAAAFFCINVGQRQSVGAANFVAEWGKEQV